MYSSTFEAGKGTDNEAGLLATEGENTLHVHKTSHSLSACKRRSYLHMCVDC